MYAEGNHEVYLMVGVSHQGITHEFFSINYKLHLQVWIKWWSYPTQLIKTQLEHPAQIHTEVEKKSLFERLSSNYIFQLFDIFYRQFYFAGLSCKNGANVA